MEIKDKNENLIGEVNPETDEYSYIGVIFENKKLVGKPFEGKVYNYKTKKDLSEGQVIEVPTRYGTSKAVVRYVDIDKDAIECPLDILLEV